MTRFLTSLAVMAASGALIAGCGDDDNDSSGASGGGGYGAAPADTATQAAPAAGGGSTALAIKAPESDGLSFDKKELTAKAGTVTITMDNPSADAMPHAVSIEGSGGVDENGETVQPGGTSKVSADLEPGTYTFYCPVGSHRQAGMEGTLTVQ
jgi:plastocyanin